MNKYVERKGKKEEKEKKKKWKKKEKRKENKKESSTELQKPDVEASVYSNNKKYDWIYAYTYTPISKLKKVQQNKVQ